MLKSRDPVTITAVRTTGCRICLYSMCASHYNGNIQWARAEQLSDGIFSMFVFQLKHTRGFQYLLINDPTEHNRSMPHIGKACKVSFSNAVFSTERILSSSLLGVGRNWGKPVKVLVACYYMAQVKQLERQFVGLLQREGITQAQQSRLDIRAIDSA
ncbi:hypothetical protein ACHAPM_001519 [Fusarium culmorum]